MIKTDATFLGNFKKAMFEANYAVAHLHNEAKGAQDAALRIVIQLLATAEEAMKTVPGIDMLDKEISEMAIG